MAKVNAHLNLHRMIGLVASHGKLHCGHIYTYVCTCV